MSVAQLRAQCAIEEVKGTFSSAESRYKGTGTCTVLGDDGVSEAYDWTAEGIYTKASKATKEKITLHKATDKKPAGWVESSMVCDKDPWRQPSGQPCRILPGRSQPLGNYSTLIFRDLKSASPDVPYTSVLSKEQRRALEMQYQVTMGTQLKPGLQGSPGSKSSLPLRSAPRTNDSAPASFGEIFRIIKPAPTSAPGSTVIHGQLVVQAKPPRVGGGPVAELEFAWLDAPPGQPYVNTFTVDTAKLVKGLRVDPQVTRFQLGRWQVRARVSGRPVPGDWTTPVPFLLVSTRSTQSQSSTPAAPSIDPAPSQGIGSDTRRIENNEQSNGSKH